MFSTTFVTLIAAAASLKGAMAAPATSLAARQETEQNSGRPSRCSGGRTARNAQCCKWFDVLDDMQTNLFHGICGQNAHQSLRIAFHDAIGISKSKGAAGGGGADGSILTFPAELQLSENLSVNGIAAKLKPFAAAHNASFGDIIQFAAIAGLTNCGNAPRIPFFANRPTATTQAPELSVPRGNDSADTMISRLADAGFSINEFVALMMSHSVAAQSAIDTNVAGAPFDTTPSTFDTQFYVETSLKGLALTGPAATRAEALSPIPGEFRLESDGNLSHDSRMVCQWQSLITQPQEAVRQFQQAMLKVSLLGQNQAKLIDCSDVIPYPKAARVSPHFPAGKTVADVDAVCPSKAFPNLPTVATPTAVAPVPPQ